MAGVKTVAARGGWRGGSAAVLVEPVYGEVHHIGPSVALGFGVEDGHKIRIEHQPYQVTPTHQRVVCGKRRKTECTLDIY